MQEQYSKQIYAKQVRTLYGTFMIAIAGSFLAAFFLMTLQWDVVEHEAMLSWFVLFSVYHLLRAVFVFYFNQTQPSDDECIIWGRGFVVSAVLAGLIWALGVYVTFTPNNLTYQLTVAIITVGLSAGSIPTLSVFIPALIAFVTPVMLSLVILFLLENTFITNVLSISMFLTMLYVMRGAKELYLSHMVNFRLLLEANDREAMLVTAKEGAEIASRTQAEFLDNMSHELRTPLHGIMGFAQVGLEKLKAQPDDNNHKYYSRIMESSQRLKILLDDLLDLRKIEEGKLELELQQCDINDIIKSCISEQEAVLHQKHLDIECDLDKNLPEIKVDKNRIAQVVFNLLSNAIKYSPQNEIITVTSFIAKDDNDNSVLQVSVADSGPGIAEEDQESVFNKFVQIKKNTASVSGSTGLGLAITKEIIHAHNGKVWLNNNENGGATFHFTLPL